MSKQYFRSLERNRTLGLLSLFKEGEEAEKMTKAEIEGLKIGDRIEHTLRTRYGKAEEGARYGAAHEVVEIFARGVNVEGGAYVCFYTELGPYARMSGSIGEGEECYRFAR